jgi:hypothetical protein
MTKAVVKRTFYDDPADAELEQWPGVEAKRVVRGKHYALVLTFNGVSRFVIYPTSPGDTRGALNHIQNIREVLREMGATRAVRRKSAAPKRKRNVVEIATVRPLEPLDAGPSRDPWEALKGVRAKLVGATPVVLPIKAADRPSWLRRAWLSACNLLQITA